MKNVFIAVFVSLIFTGIAQAEEPKQISHIKDDIESFKLIDLKIDPKSPYLGDKVIVGGTVEINHSTREVIARFYRPAPKCDAGVACPRYVLAPVVIELPIDYIGNGFCGGLVITAKEDLRTVDGGLTIISLFDDKYNPCTHTPPQGATLHMTLTEQGRASTQEYTSTFLGE